MKASKNKVQFISRIFVYSIGLFCISIGVAFAVNSDLGVSPINSLPYVISQIRGTALSICVIAVFSMYIVLQIFILKKEFKIINFTQIIFSFIFGYFVDFSKWMVGDFVIPTYAGRIVMMGISIFMIALGVTIYIQANLVPMPLEGLTLAVTHKVRKIPFPYIKVIIDCAVVASAIAVSFMFMHRLVGVREGTLISAAVTGKVVAMLQKPLKPIITRICFGRTDT